MTGGADVEKRTGGPVPGSIGQIAVTVADLDRAVAFYRDTLGLALQFRAGEMAFFAAGDQRLMLGTADGEPPAVDPDRPQFIFYFDVDDIRAAEKELEDAGAEFHEGAHRVADMGDHELWMAFFRDPDGHSLALMGRVPVD